MPRPKSRDPESDPIAALGEELERLRLAAGFSTQDALARKAGFGREAITKVESGAEVPSENLYLKWLDACGATEETRHFLDRMLADARRFRSATPEFAKPWLKAERAAEFLLLWSPGLVPDLCRRVSTSTTCSPATTIARPRRPRRLRSASSASRSWRDPTRST